MMTIIMANDRQRTISYSCLTISIVLSIFIMEILKT